MRFHRLERGSLSVSLIYFDDARELKAWAIPNTNVRHAIKSADDAWSRSRPISVYGLPVSRADWPDIGNALFRSTLRNGVIGEVA